MNSPWTRAKAKKLIHRLLSQVRNEVYELRLDIERLPKWILSANIRFGFIKNTLILAIEDSTYENDKYHEVGNVKADASILVSLADFNPKYVVFNMPEGIRNVVIATYGDGNAPLHIINSDTAICTCPYLKRHGPVAIFDHCFQITDSNNSDIVLSMRLVPVAFYLSWDDYQNQEHTIRFLTEKLIDELKRINTSSAGDRYENRQKKIDAISAAKDSTVIVLGNYDSGLFEELVSVKEYISRKGYDSQLIVDFPDVPGMTNRQKAELWTTVSKFSVMIDRKASGHITEYCDLERQKSILALLRENGKKSTSMMDDHIEELAHIRIFEFNSSPLEVIDKAVEWAESHVLLRARRT